jgi:hypothetical protein
LLLGARGRLWSCPIMLGIKCHNFPTPVALTQYWKPSGATTGSSGVCWAGGMRIYSGQTGGEILPVRGYHGGREDWYGLFPGLVLFRLVAPPLQQGVLGPYLVWGAWFLSRLLLEKPVVTGGPRYQGYKTPTPLKSKCQGVTLLWRHHDDVFLSILELIVGEYWLDHGFVWGIFPNGVKKKCVDTWMCH